MNYYWFNRQKILQKAKEKYSKEKAAEYYKQNKEAIKEKLKENYKNLSQEKKDKKYQGQKYQRQKRQKYQRKKYEELVQYKKRSAKK